MEDDTSWEFKKRSRVWKLKIGSQLDVYLERIESFKGEIIISRDSSKNEGMEKLEKILKLAKKLQHT